MFGQCIFSVYAEGEPLAYTRLIEDYYEFTSPSKIAVNDTATVVFDSGRAVVFTAEGTTSFAVGAPYCYEMCLTDTDIYLLVGDTAVRSDAAAVKAFSYAGAARELAVTETEITDIAVLDGKLLVLFEYHTTTMVFGHEVENSFPCIAHYDPDQPDAEKDVTPLTSSVEMARYFVADGSDLYLRTLEGNIVLKTENATQTVAQSPMNLSATAKNFTVKGGAIYYFKETGVYVGDSASSLIKMGEDDHTLLSATDIAVHGDLIYVADAAYRAVKVFHASTGEARRYIGSYGKDVGRLSAPIAVSVRDGKVAVVDGSMRASVFSNGRVNVLNGHRITAPTDIEITSNAVYLADDGILCAYDSSYLFERDYSLGVAVRYVAAGADGSVYVAAGNDVYVKKAEDLEFSLLVRLESAVDRLNIGIGGKVIYALSDNKVYAYTPNGDMLAGHSEPTQTIVDFTVDYRGNLFLLTSAGEIVRYSRTVNGYKDATVFYVGDDFDSYADIAVDRDGTVWLLADHNVISIAKDAVGVVVGADSDFADEVPTEDVYFVCVVTAPSTIAYVRPDNFEDISYLSKGTKLMCYARVNYAENEYLRVETDKGTAYVPSEDVSVYEGGVPRVTHVRCLHTKVGVDIFKTPSYIEREPLYTALGKESIFEVLSIVAVDEAGKDVWGFYRVRYEDQVGYVLIENVVSVDEDPVPIERYKMKIKAEKLGKMVVLYENASVDSEEVVRLADGTEIYALEPLDEEKEFIQVLYDGKVCYVQPQYLGQGGLSAGQTLAIVLSVVTVTASIIMFLIFRAGKRRKIEYKE